MAVSPRQAANWQVETRLRNHYCDGRMDCVIWPTWYSCILLNFFHTWTAAEWGVGRVNKASSSVWRVEVACPLKCITDADNAAVYLSECVSLSDYDKANIECQKTEFRFEFINQTSNFRTSFNIPTPFTWLHGRWLLQGQIRLGRLARLGHLTWRV